VIEVVVCKRGMGQHAPDLASRVEGLSTVECFDKCEMCERFLLARVDGATMRFRDADELLAALDALRDA
jgi:hypothetical protein